MSFRSGAAAEEPAVRVQRNKSMRKWERLRLRIELARPISAVHAYPRHRAIHHPRHLRPILGGPILPQLPLRPLRRKPCPVPICFLRRPQPQDFAKICMHNARPKLLHVNPLPPPIPRKRRFLHPPVHPGFFKRLQPRRLRMRQPRLHPALRKRPPPLARPHQ